MIKGLIRQFLIKAVVMALLALILYGIFPGSTLVVILLLIVGLRFAVLATEAFRTSGQEAHGERRPPMSAHRDQKPSGGSAGHGPGQLARSRLQRAVPEAGAPAHKTAAPPRSRRELAAEGLGVVAYVLLLPLAVALYTRDIFSFAASQGWEGAVVAAVCVGLYAYPHLGFKGPEFSEFRILWWVLPFVAGLLLVTHEVNTRHPYLNPFNPDRARLAADRVLSQSNNVVAGRQAGWVLRYARQLDQRGEAKTAIHYYHEALRLDPTQRAAYQRLAVLETTASAEQDLAKPTTVVPASAPYWDVGHPILKPPRQHIGVELESVEECTVVIVSLGEVPEHTLDAVGHVLHNELDLPVCISPDSVSLPPYSRKRGLLTAEQWTADSLVQAFTNAITRFPKAPIKYVLITSADIYVPDVNYVFSTSYPWGAVLSSAKFESAGGDQELVCRRTAKQALGALIKSFNVPASTDRDCVTSYCSGLPEFDSKGSRPNAETLKLFRQAVEQVNQAWQKHKVQVLLRRPP